MPDGMGGDFGIDRCTISARLKSGWEVHRTLTTPGADTD
jgi:hypothetical protein